MLNGNNTLNTAAASTRVAGFELLSKYADALYGRAEPEHGLVNVFAKDPYYSGCFQPDSPHFLSLTKIKSRWQDIYFSVNLIRPESKAAIRQRRGRAKELDVSAVVALVADIDASKPGRNYPPQQKILSALQAMPLLPSIVNISGKADGGLHAYWLLHEPHATASADARDFVKVRSKAWQDLLRTKLGGYGLDSTHDLSRVLRPAGTTNHKYGSLVQPLIFEPNRRYALDDFEQFIPQELLTIAMQAIGPAGSTPDYADEPFIDLARAELAEMAQHAAWRASAGLVRHGFDFQILIEAHRRRWPQLAVWEAVQSISKFATDGWDYFIRSWDRAKSIADDRAKVEDELAATVFIDRKPAKGPRSVIHRSRESDATGDASPPLVSCCGGVLQLPAEQVNGDGASLGWSELSSAEIPASRLIEPKPPELPSYSLRDCRNTIGIVAKDQLEPRKHKAMLCPCRSRSCSGCGRTWNDRHIVWYKHQLECTQGELHVIEFPRDEWIKHKKRLRTWCAKNGVEERYLGIETESSPGNVTMLLTAPIEGSQPISKEEAKCWVTANVLDARKSDSQDTRPRILDCRAWKLPPPKEPEKIHVEQKDESGNVVCNDQGNPRLIEDNRWKVVGFLQSASFSSIANALTNNGISYKFFESCPRNPEIELFKFSVPHDPREQAELWREMGLLTKETKLEREVAEQVCLT